MDRAAQECWENHQERENKYRVLQGTVDYLRLEYHKMKSERDKLKNENESLITKVRRNRIGWISTALSGIASALILIIVQ